MIDIAVRAQERRAHKLMLQGNLDGAIAVYREILSLDPECATAHYQLGLCYRQRRQWEDAVRVLARARDLGEARAIPLLNELQTSRPPHNVNDAADEPAVVVGSRVLTRSRPSETPPQQHDAQGVQASGSGVAEPRGLYAAGSEHRRGERPEDEAPIVCPPLAPIFAPGGALTQALGSRFRARAGQLEMASLVREALQNRQHAILEAGTGIGKSFAYLIPVLWSGASAIVSTSNKGLMNQLWEKDLPTLQRIAPHPTKTALLKGRGNYICALRLDRLRQQVGLPNQPALLAQVRKGLERVPNGDVEMMKLPPELAARLTVSGHECRGRHCPQFDRCLYEEAKRQAAEADVVVTNHALLCTSALLADQHILPVRSVLIIDEAHQLTRYAIEALTKTLGQEQFWSLINHPTLRAAAPDEELLVEARAAYEAFFQAAERQRPGHATSRNRPARWELSGEIEAGLALWGTLMQLQRSLAHAAHLDEGEREAIATQTEEVAATARALATPEPETHIRLCERASDGQLDSEDAYHALYLPLVATDPLRRQLFNAWPRVICTSATLGVNNDLTWFGRQVGLFAGHDEQPVIARAIPGPFDYPRQMVLYTPKALTPVYDEARQAFAGTYVDALTEEVAQLLEASRGRALVLCTSRRRMTQLYDTLAPVLNPRYPCYLQGELAQPELVARFKRDGNAILFATRGFWEGLDIPGDALALVILDKIPFVPYDDPVIRRREAQITAEGGNAFYELQLGSAILNLRQGAGRLIRSETDRGVIALLDARVLHKRYGQQIIRSLPEGCHTTDFADVVAFLSRR